MSKVATSAQPSKTGRSKQVELLPEFSEWVNRVHLVGRVSSESEEIELPSGESLVRFRLVVPRQLSAREKSLTKTTVDTIDCVTFQSGLQRKCRKLLVGQIVELEGKIRRRFWKAGAGVASRVEIEVMTINKVD
ncbi:MAG: single-stranded DNA-binding protein [Actinomycetales bacterium]|nr:single-stranded DNA-binding protein [Actinomycetales bacterium]